MKRIGCMFGLSFLIQSGFCGATEYDEMFKVKLKISDIVVMHKGGSIFDITTPDKKVTTCDVSKWNNSKGNPISVARNNGFDICSITNKEFGTLNFTWWNNALTVLNSSYHGNVAVKADSIRILHSSKFNNFYAQGKTISNQGNLGAQGAITLFAPRMSFDGMIVTDQNIWNYKWPTASNNSYHVDANSLSQDTLYNSGVIKADKIEIRDLSLFGPGRIIGKGAVSDSSLQQNSQRVLQQLGSLQWSHKIHDQNLVDIAKGTVDIMKKGKIKTFQLPQNNYCKSILIDPKLQSRIGKSVPKPNKSKCNIKNSKYLVTNEDSFEASKDYEDPLVMNLANAFRPGGGFLMGSRAQEESLCRSSTLYASLLSNKQGYHDYNRDLRENTKKKYHNRGGLFGLDRMLISPWVYVFRDSNYKLINPYETAVITIAAPDLGDGEGGKHHTGEAYTAIQHKVTDQNKMRNAILKQLRDMIVTAAYYGYKNLVLGAFGCGAFAQDPHVIAQIYYEILVNEGYGSYFNNIKFSVKGHDARACRLRDAFNFVFQTEIEEFESNENKKMETINSSMLVDYIDLKNGYFLEKNRAGNTYLMVHIGGGNYRHTTVGEKLEVLENFGGTMSYGGIQSIDDQIVDLVLKKKKFGWSKSLSQSVGRTQSAANKQHKFDEYNKYKYLGDIDLKHPGRLYVLERKTTRSEGKINKEVFAMAFDQNKDGPCLREIDDNEKQVVLSHLYNVWNYRYNNQKFNHKSGSVGGKIAEIALAMYGW